MSPSCPSSLHQRCPSCFTLNLGAAPDHLNDADGVKCSYFSRGRRHPFSSAPTRECRCQSASNVFPFWLNKTQEPESLKIEQFIFCQCCALHDTVSEKSRLCAKFQCQHRPQTKLLDTLQYHTYILKVTRTLQLLKQLLCPQL